MPHRKLNENLISISITRVCLSKSPITVEYLSKPQNFPEMIKMIKDINGIPFFTSNKLMKLSESAGHFLLLMMKEKLKSTEQALNIFFEMMAAKGYHDLMGHNYEQIAQTNFIAPNCFSKSFSGYSSKYTLDPNDTDTSAT
jgi:hypothetical protein